MHERDHGQLHARTCSHVDPGNASRPPCPAQPSRGLLLLLRKHPRANAKRQIVIGFKDRSLATTSSAVIADPTASRKKPVFWKAVNRDPSLLVSSGRAGGLLQGEVKNPARVVQGEWCGLVNRQQQRCWAPTLLLVAVLFAAGGVTLARRWTVDLISAGAERQVPDSVKCPACRLGSGTVKRLIPDGGVSVVSRVVGASVTG